MKGSSSRGGSGIVLEDLNSSNKPSGAGVAVPTAPDRVGFGVDVVDAIMAERERQERENATTTGGVAILAAPSPIGDDADGAGGSPGGGRASSLCCGGGGDGGDKEAGGGGEIESLEVAGDPGAHEESNLIGSKGSEAPKKAVSSIPGGTVNLCKTMIGAGILGLPYAVSHTGLLIGGLFILLFAGASIFGLLLLVHCGMLLEKRWKLRGLEKKLKDGMSFYSIGQEVAPKTAILIDIALAIKCFGVTCSYLLILGQLLPDIMKMFILDGPTLLYSRYLWISSAMLILAPLSFLRKLDNLKFTSTLGLISICYVVCLIIGYYIKGDGVVDFSEVKLVNFSIKTPDAIPIFVFAYTCHQNIFTIYNELGPNNLRKRSSIVILTSVPLVCVVYLTESLIGYLTFGPNVDSNIINNYPTGNIPAMIARCCTSLIVSCSYPLLFHPARAYLDSAVFSKWKPRWLPPFERYIVETLVLLACGYTLAMLVEDLDLVFGVIGATGSTLLCYILPGAYYVLLTKGHPWNLIRICALVMSLTGVVLMVVCLTFIFLNEFVWS
ncbi:vacuolar amino acid transporter 6 [Pelomyxa schiedti]|nr:vacuolar amino acid transporter 6 [Pelomyxa schiedti]